tara:strand:+ start:28401 stop:28892 length:492 start_codon:yes stop_codon:yes gene_type:complete
MCDQIIRRNLPESDIPKYVYKRVQKTGDNKYISPVMGEPMSFGKWKKATIHEKPKDGNVSFVKSVKRIHRKVLTANSSPFTSFHNGKWGVFEHKEDARMAFLVSNFGFEENCIIRPNRPPFMMAFPTIVVECEIKGVVHKGMYNQDSTFLASHIKIVREVISL